MKCLGIIFSSRKQGNCTQSVKYCLDKISLHKYQVEMINIFDHEVQGCGNCSYHCFESRACSKEDDILQLYKKCFEADKIIFAIPTFCGHLASTYFQFWERAQAIFKDSLEYENNFLKKLNFIIIGNLSSGGDMALHEALYGIRNRSFYPEAILLSPREYNNSSIKGNLIESDDVKKRLNSFIEKIINQR